MKTIATLLLFASLWSQGAHAGGAWTDVTEEAGPFDTGCEYKFETVYPETGHAITLYMLLVEPDKLSTMAAGNYSGWRVVESEDKSLIKPEGPSKGMKGHTLKRCQTD